MTKFLRQTCEVQAYKLDKSGETALSSLGEPEYSAPIRRQCRREMCHRDIQTSNGSLVKAVARYYLDESLVILPGFKIDGHVVLDVAEYINGLGKCEGFEVYV